MISTISKNKKKSGRKQIRLSDLYRYMVTGIVSNIKGIDDYHATTLAINVRYSHRPGVSTYHTNDELDRKKAIIEINKILSEV